MKKILLLFALVSIGTYCSAQLSDEANPKYHFISVEKAKNMIRKYKEHKDRVRMGQIKDVFAVTESFDILPFITLLAKPGVKRLRIYYGMTEALRVHAIIVGVDANGADMIDGEDAIIEQGIVCPPLCPKKPSDLDPTE